MRKVKCATFVCIATPCLLDHVNRQFMADRLNLLRASDFTYMFTRRIGSWCGSSSMHTAFVLDDLG